MSKARLIETRTPADPAGVVLVLHGGANRPGNPMVSPTQLSVIRMIPIAKRIAQAGSGRLAVFRLLNTHRGWDSHTTPVHDVRWAIGQVHERYDAAPIALVGHSLGGRAAIMAGNHPDVRVVVALNPWVYPQDDNNLSGRQVLVVHGTEDRIAVPQRARHVADRLARRADVEFRTVEGGKHAMLRHGREFERAAADFVVEHLA